MSEWFFTSDLHGQGALYEQLVALVAAHRPAALVLGGDLAPHAAGAEGVRRQRLFLEGFFVEFARRVREAAPGVELLVLLGNDDWAANLDVLEALDGTLWRLLHDRVVEVGGVRVAGLAWVPITPFGHQGLGALGRRRPESPARLDGWVSRAGGLEPVRFDPARRAPTIAGRARRSWARGRGRRRSTCCTRRRATRPATRPARGRTSARARSARSSSGSSRRSSCAGTSTSRPGSRAPGATRSAAPWS